MERKIVLVTDSSRGIEKTIVTDFAEKDKNDTHSTNYNINYDTYILGFFYLFELLIKFFLIYNSYFFLKA